MNIVYRDRYLNETGAKILVDLLRCDGLTVDSSITIWVLENYKGELASKQKTNLENAILNVKNMRVPITVKIQPWHERSHFPHAREMEVKTENGQRYSILFDKGMAFLELKINGAYSVLNPTYVVINKQG